MKGENITPRQEILPGPPPQRMMVWEYPDGTVVRYKPDGDEFRSGPTYSVEVKKDPNVGDAAAKQEGIAFKVDENGNPVPKGPDDIANPYSGNGSPEQVDEYKKRAMDAGHKEFPPDPPPPPPKDPDAPDAPTDPGTGP
jgi:hypothetical protein